MNALAEKYGDKVAILGYPCNQFGHQTNEDNAEFLNTLKYVRPGGNFEPAPTITIMEKGDVNGENAQPVWEWLRTELSLALLACLERVQKIAGKEVAFHNVDIRDKEGLAAVFAQHSVGAVIHFAGLKAVGESVAQPLMYYQVNVEGTLNLLEAMDDAGVGDIVFSSSATVYGDPATVPVTESFPTGPTNPYGHSKLFNEQILRDFAASRPEWNVCLLRYFNPVGAHPSGMIGEDPKGIPNNLMPYIQQVAVGKRPHLAVFGDDYPTADGTGVRDYIHVRAQIPRIAQLSPWRSTTL